MGVQLKPQQHFTVVRQIANHLDESTYYVRAVIRNAYTDAILATLDLDDKGSQRFSKNWTVPADPSGQGFYISIITSVYSDSGYTTKSENYGDEEQTHLVAELPTATRFGGGGGLDSGTIRRIIKEELEKAKPEPIEPEKEEKEVVKEEMRWGEVLAAIGYLQGIVEKIPQEKVDLSGVLQKLDDVLLEIQVKPVTPETDLSPVLAGIQELKLEVDAIDQEQRLVLEDHMTQLREELPGLIDENAGAAMSRANFNLNMPFGMTLDSMKHREKEPEQSPLDINQLTQ